MGTSWKLVLVFGLCLTCVEPAHGQRRGGTGGGRASGGARYGGGGAGYGDRRSRLWSIGGTGRRRNDQSGDSPERVTPGWRRRGLPAQHGRTESRRDKPAIATTGHDARSNTALARRTDLGREG